MERFFALKTSLLIAAFAAFSGGCGENADNEDTPSAPLQAADTSTQPANDAGPVLLPDAMSPPPPSPDASAYIDCPLVDTEPPSQYCAPQTSTCLDQATSDDEWDGCWDADPGCLECLSTSYQHCVVGTARKPGRCAEPFALVYQCLTIVCGENVDRACGEGAIAGPCEALYSDMRACDDIDLPANQSCYDESFDTCLPPACVPQCSGKTCGDDGCGGSCGTCPSPESCLADGQCSCTPNCNGRDCGSDGCGGSCGLCSNDTICDLAGQCVCKSDCSGKTCGDDGCGGSCGTCPSPESCLANGQCSCTPSCGDDECGDDGCGGSCGSCSSSEICRWGQCCAPNCSGLVCGSDGCGGSCGTCSTGSNCVSGQCEVDEDYCDPVRNTGCAYPNECILLSTEETRCALLGSGTQGDYCSSYTLCDGGYGCFAGICRKICSLYYSSDCAYGETCTGVTGWSRYGACN